MNANPQLQKIKSFFAQLKAALYKHYSAPQIHMFKTLRNGFMLFFSGLVSVYIANTNLQDSLQQEFVVLAGLILCGIGFLIAMTSYIRLVISRIVLFFTRK